MAAFLKNLMSSPNFQPLEMPTAAAAASKTVVPSQATVRPAAAWMIRSKPMSALLVPQAPQVP